MDLGLDLIANPSKIKKKTYTVNKKEDFDLNEFILETVIEELQRVKPSGSKGKYLKKVVVSSTMGPGIKIDENNL